MLCGVDVVGCFGDMDFGKWVVFGFFFGECCVYLFVLVFDVCGVGIVGYVDNWC